MKVYEYMMEAEMHMGEYVLILFAVMVASTVLIGYIFDKMQKRQIERKKLIIACVALIAVMFAAGRIFFMDTLQIWYIKAPFIGIMFGLCCNAVDLCFKLRKR